MGIFYNFLENVPYDSIKYIWSAANDEDAIYHRNFGSTVDFYEPEIEEDNFLCGFKNVSQTTEDKTQDCDFWFWMSYLWPFGFTETEDGELLAEYIEPNVQYLVTNICGVPLYVYTEDNETLYVTTPGAKPLKLENYWIGVCFTHYVYEPVFSHCEFTTICYIGTSFKKNDEIKTYYIPDAYDDKDYWTINVGYWEFVNSRLLEFIIPCNMDTARITANNISFTNPTYKKDILNTDLDKSTERIIIKSVYPLFNLKRNVHCNIKDIHTDTLRKIKPVHQTITFECNRNIIKTINAKQNTERVIEKTITAKTGDTIRKMNKSLNLVSDLARNIQSNQLHDLKRYIMRSNLIFDYCVRRILAKNITTITKTCKRDVLKVNVSSDILRIVHSDKKQTFAFVINNGYVLKDSNH